MDFATLPPEVNSARMYAGPGSGPMLAAATAWDGLAAQLHATAASYDSVLSGLTGWSWQGPASASMLSAAAPYVAWMRPSAAQSILSNGPSAMSVIPQALQALASPAAVDPTSLTGLLTALTLIVIPLTAVDIPIATASATASTTSATASFTSVGTTFRVLLINADRDFADGKGPFTGNGPGGTMLPEWIINGVGGVGAPSDAAPSPVSAGLGQATNVGKLSAPPNWASAAPAFRTVAYSVPMTGAGAAPEIVAGGSGGLFSDLALAGLAGRAVGSTAYPSRPAGRADQRVQVTGGHQPKPPEPVGTGMAQEIAAELRELAAHAQSLLTKLHESGLMSPEEITVERKRSPF